MILNPDTGLANMLSNVTDAKADGFDTIGGVQTVRLTGKVTPTRSTSSSPSSRPLRLLPATVWIEKDAPNQLVREGGPEREQQRAAPTPSEWDKPVTVTKPAV